MLSYLQISNAFLMSPAMADTFLAQNWTADVSRTLLPSSTCKKLNASYLQSARLYCKLQAAFFPPQLTAWEPWIEVEKQGAIIYGLRKWLDLTLSLLFIPH